MQLLWQPDLTELQVVGGPALYERRLVRVELKRSSQDHHHTYTGTHHDITTVLVLIMYSGGGGIR